MVFCHRCGKELPPGAGFCPTCGASVPSYAVSGSSATIASPQLSGQMVGLATAGDRIVAVIIDSLILVVGTLLVGIPIGLLGTFSFGLLPGFFFGGFALLWWLLWLLYFSFFEGTSGQTLGKQAVRIRVVDEATLRTVPLGRAFVRNILRIIDWLPFFYLIGFILVETQPKRKRLGDLAANTIVVRA